MLAQYPIRAAAKLTGIPVDTLRAWERRYSAVTPVRSGRGRLYGEADLRRLRLLKSAVESGRSIGQVASLSDADLEELDRKLRSFRAKEAQPLPSAVLPALRPLMDAVAAYDCTAANTELSRLALLLHPGELVHRVILPMMRTAGERWESGDLRIAQEHMLSECVRDLLGGLLRLQNGAPGPGTLVFTTPAGELHEFGILSAALLAVERHYGVVYLGPNLPATEILLAAEKSGPQAVVLGIMALNATPVVREEVRRLAAELPADTGLWLGGSGAADAAGGVERDGLVVLDDLERFEETLDRKREAR